MHWLPLSDYRIVLASQSPRRQQLLRDLGLEFEVRTRPVDEVYPPELEREQIAIYLSQLKSKAFAHDLAADELLITADTIVWVAGQSIAKPADAQEAKAMLQLLSGRSHEVITGVSLSTRERSHAFAEITHVHFQTLSEAEIEHYVEHYRPFDKAGSYGIQEWIGYVGIPGIEGCYFNVVGLPLNRLYRELQQFLRPD